MHYANGRQAVAGDRVVRIDDKGPTHGVVYALTGGSDTCNGRLAEDRSNNPYINLRDYVHVDDAQSGALATKKPADQS